LFSTFLWEVWQWTSIVKQRYFCLRKSATMHWNVSRETIDDVQRNAPTSVGKALGACRNGVRWYASWETLSVGLSQLLRRLPSRRTKAVSSRCCYATRVLGARRDYI
jgi:hypothetical protein